MAVSDVRHRYWRKNLCITWGLGLVWFVVTFGVSYFARALDFSFFGWSFSFWMAAQGSLLVYCLIVWVYSRYMAGVDDEYEAQEHIP